jgi:hypothetical protein
MSNTEQTKTTLTAAQRLEVLEKSIVTMDQALGGLGRQAQMLQEALTLLNDKVSAMVIALSSGILVNEENLNEINTQQKVADMKSKVEKLLSDGIVTKSEEVTQNSFVVVRELDSESGKVVNPRLQFVARVLDEESLNKMLGKKTGDSVRFTDENPGVIEIEEIYEIQSQTTQPEEASTQTQQA